LKYSIIIPALNEEKLLSGLLNQLTELKNTFDYEIIVSDGGSNDKTVEIALQLADIVKVHNSDSKQNIAMGRNEGAKLARGEFLVFLNADIRLPGAVKFFNYLEKVFNSDCYAAFTCKVKVFPDEEKFSDRLFHNIYNSFFKFLNDTGGGMGRGECQVVRKNVFETINGYDDKKAAGEDLDLFRRVKQLGKILFSNEICVYESPRRYRKYGYLYISFSWIKNGLSVLLTNKSVSKIWEQVR
jgi:glycosyltransferase involved in cell wall biosynthesis